MNLFKTNKLKYFLRIVITYSFLLFGITYIISLAAMYWFEIEMSYEPYILTLLIFLIVIVLSLFDVNTSIKINNNNIKRISFFRTSDIQWKNITSIKFNYVLRTLSLSENNNRIIIGSYFVQYNKMLELIYKMLVENEKGHLAPKYIIKRVQEK